MADIYNQSVANAIIDFIDQSLSDDKPKPASFVYDLAEKSFGLSKEEIPKNPEAFEKALEGAFGSDSAVIKMDMKKLIVETFHLREDLSNQELSDLISEIEISVSTLVEYRTFFWITINLGCDAL